MGGANTSKFDDFWIFGPLGTRIYGFEYTKNISKHIRKYGNIFEEYYFIDLIFRNPKVLQLPKRRAPANGEDPFNNILKIMDTRSISIKKHDVEIW